MDNSPEMIRARQTLRLSPWSFGGAVLFGTATCFYGFAPVSYLLMCVGLAVAWYFLIALSWRRRSEFLRVFSLVFAIFGQQILWHRFGGGHSLEILQGFSVVIAVWSVLLMLSRRWLYKFSRLHDHVA